MNNDTKTPHGSKSAMFTCLSNRTTGLLCHSDRAQRVEKSGLCAAWIFRRPDLSTTSRRDTGIPVEMTAGARPLTLVHLVRAKAEMSKCGSQKIGSRTLIVMIAAIMLSVSALQAGQYVFSVQGEKTYLNGQNILVKGLRCSNALISDSSTDELIANLDTFASYGVNTVSVFFMGSRFGDIKGYNEDGSLNPIFAERMGRIIEAADRHGMIILVGCLYWSTSKAKWENWTQAQANTAIANTVRWLKEHDYRNVFVDVDNEGMALRAKGFDNRLLVQAGKNVNPDCVIATNFKGDPPPEADLGIHHSNKVAGKPYIESEGTPPNAPGGYWGTYSKKDGYYNYINIGLYNEQMKARQKEITVEHFRKGWGYMCASTWLQCVPPYGPNNSPGGDGSKKSPGVKWWLEFIRDTYGPYVPPPPSK